MRLESTQGENFERDIGLSYYGEKSEGEGEGGSIYNEGPIREERLRDNDRLKY